MENTLPLLNPNNERPKVELGEQSTEKFAQVLSVNESLKSLLSNISTTLIETNNFTKMLGEIISTGFTELNSGLKSTFDGILDVEKKRNDTEKHRDDRQEAEDIENKREKKSSFNFLDSAKSLANSGLNTAKNLPSLINSFYGALLDPAKMLALIGGGAILSKIVAPKSLAAFAAFSAAIADSYMAVLESENQNTSKISAALSGFISGEGTKKMFGQIAGSALNVGGWALMGATVGSVVPVVGTFAGAIVGAAIGAIGSLLGQQYLADKLDSLGVWFRRNIDVIFGTNFRLDKEKLAKEKEKAEAFISSKTEEIKKLQDDILLERGKLSEAMKSGDAALVSSIRENIDILNSQLESQEQDLNREKEKLKTVIADQKLEQASWFERNLATFKYLSPAAWYADAASGGNETLNEYKEKVKTKTIQLFASSYEVLIKFLEERWAWAESKTFEAYERHKANITSWYESSKNTMESFYERTKVFLGDKKDFAVEATGNLSDMVSNRLAEIKNSISEAFDKFVADAKKWVSDNFKFDFSFEGAKKFFGFSQPKPEKVEISETPLIIEKQKPSISGQLANETLGKLYSTWVKEGKENASASQFNTTNNNNQTSVLNTSNYTIMPPTSDPSFIFR